MLCAKCGVEVVVCHDVFDPSRAVTLTAPVGVGGIHRPIRLSHEQECGKGSKTMQVLAWIAKEGPKTTDEIRDEFGATWMIGNLRCAGHLEFNGRNLVATEKGRDKVRAM